MLGIRLSLEPGKVVSFVFGYFLLGERVHVSEIFM